MLSAGKFSVDDSSVIVPLSDNTALGIKKARQLKHAVGVYLEEEAKLRAELDAEKARHEVLG